MYVKAATVDQVKPGRGFGVRLNQLFVGIYNVDGEYFAIDDVCPHMGASLHHGWLDGCVVSVSYTHLRAHETREDRVCRRGG